MIALLRKKLWESIYLNPVTPTELMSNLNDPDYLSVESYNSEEELRIILSFKDEGELVKTIYNFDNNNLLQSIVMLESDTESVIFNRQEQITLILNEISICKKENFSLENCSA